LSFLDDIDAPVKQKRYPAGTVERIRSVIGSAQLIAAKHLRRVVAGETEDASETKLTGQTKAALVLVQGAMAAQRAEKQGGETRMFGVVVLQDRVEDHQAWEQMAASVQRPAIEAMAMRREPDGA